MCDRRLCGQQGCRATSDRASQAPRIPRVPTGTRWICGTARTDMFGDVDLVVRASDAGEPGTADEFEIQLTQNGTVGHATADFSGSTDPQSGGGVGGGGNIQLH